MEGFHRDGNEMTKGKIRMVERFKNKPVPNWVTRLPGPLQQNSIEEVCKEVFTEDFRLLLMKWSKLYMKDMLTNIAVPVIKFESGNPFFEYSLLLGDPEDVLRMGRVHPSKDLGLLPFEARNVVNTPDTQDWRIQRETIIDAFLPLHCLSKLVPSMDRDAIELMQRMQHRGPVVDVKDELHHAALTIYIHNLLGVDDPYDVPLQECEPKHSRLAREVFNLEIGDMRSQSSVAEKFAKGIEFVNRVVEKGKRIKPMAPLLERVLSLDDQSLVIENLMALMTAGHDTTAYTTQFCLFELARHHRYQEKAREEVLQLLAECNGNLRYADLRKLDFVGKCIAETLRLWNVAMVTFRRRTSTVDEIKGPNGEPIEIPKGTPFNFWFFGQHHSQKFWGEDALVFNPERAFHNHEMQLGNSAEEAKFSSQTPCTFRFHPFSVPRRDCLGKNFAMIEMKLLISRILEVYTLRLAGETEQAADIVVGDNNVYRSWCDQSSGTVQPKHIYLEIIPRNSKM